MSIADWYVVGIGAVAVLSLLGRLLWAMSDPYSWSSWRESWSRPAPADPSVRNEPAPRAPDAPPRLPNISAKPAVKPRPKQGPTHSTR